MMLFRNTASELDPLAHALHGQHNQAIRLKITLSHVHHVADLQTQAAQQSLRQRDLSVRADLYWAIRFGHLFDDTSFCIFKTSAYA